MDFRDGLVIDQSQDQKQLAAINCFKLQNDVI